MKSGIHFPAVLITGMGGSTETFAVFPPGIGL